MNYKDLTSKSTSQRAIARVSGISRTTLHLLNEGKLNPTLRSLEKLSDAMGLDLYVLRYPKDTSMNSEFSTAVVSHIVASEGFESWKIYFMNLVDEVRRSKDSRLFICPPVSTLPLKLSALLSAIVLELCKEQKWQAPQWAVDHAPLSKPWFVSGSEALKASAILESPISFKSKNIFVLENFLKRV